MVRVPFLLVLYTVLALVAIAPHACSALHYGFTSNSKEICFVEEVGATTDTITGTYTWRPHVVNSAIRMRIITTSPVGAVIQTTDMKVGKHSFAIKIPSSKQHSRGGKETGAYHLCASMTSPTTVVETTPVYVDFDIDQAVIHELRSKSKPNTMDEAPSREVTSDGMGVYRVRGADGKTTTHTLPLPYLNRVTLMLDEIDRSMQVVESEIAYSSNREWRMRLTAEDTFTRIWVCGLLICAAVALMAAVQLRWLQSTIKRKKLI